MQRLDRDIELCRPKVGPEAVEEDGGGPVVASVFRQLGVEEAPFVGAGQCWPQSRSAPG
jgi:hypothetical protein